MPDIAVRAVAVRWAVYREVCLAAGVQGRGRFDRHDGLRWMKTLSFSHLVHAVGTRLVRGARFVIFLVAARPLEAECSNLLRVNGNSPVDLRRQAMQAMQMAVEPNDLVAQRFAHGDEFMGWLEDGCVVSFGWVAYHGRAIHGLRLKDIPGRVFLYNFHTLAAHRGQGLYTKLLVAIRQRLGREGVAEFVIDVESRNKASIHGVERAGFAAVVTVGFLVFFNHWYWLRWRSVVAGMQQELFSK